MIARDDHCDVGRGAGVVQRAQRIVDEHGGLSRQREIAQVSDLIEVREVDDDDVGARIRDGLQRRGRV